MAQVPFEGPHSFLISSKLLHECLDVDGQKAWQNFLTSIRDSCVTYLDGSFEICYDKLSDTESNRFERLRRALLEACWAKRSFEQRPAGLEGFQTHFRALWGDPIRSYTLWYPDSVQRDLGDQSLLVLPDAWADVPENGHPRSRLPIAIMMQHKPDAVTRQHSRQVLAAWFANTSSSRIRDEGPVHPVDDKVEWRGRVAFFTADFSTSGQHTLNWLLLFLVNNSSHFPIELVSFGCTNAPLLKKGSQGKAVSEPLRMPGQALPFPTGNRDERSLAPGLRLIRQPGFSPDLGTLEVALVDPAEPEERAQLTELIWAWLRIGMNGGFKGAFVYHSPVEWSEDALTFKFQVDFGTADVESSLLILTRVLGNQSREGVRIDTLSIA